jgi:hypothetical protein
MKAKICERGNGRGSTVTRDASDEVLHLPTSGAASLFNTAKSRKRKETQEVSPRQQGRTGPERWPTVAIGAAVREQTRMTPPTRRRCHRPRPRGSLSCTLLLFHARRCFQFDSAGTVGRHDRLARVMQRYSAVLARRRPGQHPSIAQGRTAWSHPAREGAESDGGEWNGQGG